MLDVDNDSTPSTCTVDTRYDEVDDKVVRVCKAECKDSITVTYRHAMAGLWSNLDCGTRCPHSVNNFTTLPLIYGENIPIQYRQVILALRTAGSDQRLGVQPRAQTHAKGVHVCILCGQRDKNFRNTLQLGVPNGRNNGDRGSDNYDSRRMFRHISRALVLHLLFDCKETCAQLPVPPHVHVPALVYGESLRLTVDVNVDNPDGMNTPERKSNLDTVTRRTLVLTQNLADVRREVVRCKLSGCASCAHVETILDRKFSEPSEHGHIDKLITSKKSNLDAVEDEQTRKQLSVCHVPVPVHALRILAGCTCCISNTSRNTQENSTSGHTIPVDAQTNINNNNNIPPISKQTSGKKEAEQSRVCMSTLRATQCLYDLVVMRVSDHQTAHQ